MDSSGHIHRMREDEARAKGMLPLSDQQAEEQRLRSPRKRKAWMRNQPCVCGSGKKFKKCCWSRVTQAQLKQMGTLTKGGRKEPLL